MAAKIAADLNTLGKADLYEYLGTPPRTSTETLKKAAERRNRELMSKPHREPENTERRLVGLATTVFQSDEMRNRYDHTRSVAVLDPLKGRIHVAKQGEFILPDAYEVLVRQGVGLGVAESDVREFVLDFAQQAKIKVVTVDSKGATPKRLLVCGSPKCPSPIADEADQMCRGCGAPLYMDCPRCSKRVPSSDRACGNCGARTGDYPLVLDAVRKIRAALDKSDLASATRLFQEIRSDLGDWPELSKVGAEIEQHRREEAARQAQRQQEQAAREKAIQTLVREKRVTTARKQLPTGAKARGESQILISLDEQIAAALTVADGFFASALHAEKKGDNETAAVLIEKTLDVCIDHELAKQAAARLPRPSAPLNLNAEVRGKSVHLAWAKPATRRAMRFQIVRRSGRPARTPEDGDNVCVTGGTSWDDQPPPGTAWHYAVFALWLDWISVPASAAPVLLREAVRGFSALPRMGAVALRWKRPAGATHVRIVRKKGGVPASDADGTTLDARSDELTDSYLQNGQPYGYRVTPCYPDPLQPGSVLEGPPATATAVPVAPAPTVDDLQATWEPPATLVLKWTPPTADDTQILLVPKDREPRPGTVLDAGEAASLGEVLVTSRAGNARVVLNRQGLFSIVPLSLRSGLATVGKAVPLNTLRGVGNVRADGNGDRVVVTWDWSTEFVSATMRVATDRHEERVVGGSAETHRITREAYREAGGLDLGPRPPGTLFITVLGRTAAGVDAPPVPATYAHQMEVRVTYRVEPGGRIWGSPRLILRSNRTVRLPRLIAVAKRFELPEDKDDGDPILPIAAQTIEQGQEALFEIDDKRLPGRDSFVKLFFASEADAGAGVRLMAADKDKLRLG
jgi:hypothetical protein